MADWRNRVQQFAVGDKVCFKASWLRNTGQYTGEVPFLRGVILELKGMDGPIPRAVVDWQNGADPATVGLATLSKITERGIPDE